MLFRSNDTATTEIYTLSLHDALPILIIISHRLSTTRFADKIYMLANGEIIESGTHEKLIKQNGKYAEMFRLQAEKYR